MADTALWITTSSLPLMFTRWSRLASATFATSRRYISSMINLEPPPPQAAAVHHTLPPPHSILFLEALILFINLIQLKFNGKQNSPFETYPIPMAIVVVTLIIYFISLEASHWLPFINSVIINHLAAVSGYTCIICITSVLLPSKVVKPYFYLSCPLIFATAMVCSILKLQRRRQPGEQSVWRRRMSQRFSEKLWSLCRNGVREFSSTHGGCVLPR